MLVWNTKLNYLLRYLTATTAISYFVSILCKSWHLAKLMPSILNSNSQILRSSSLVNVLDVARLPIAVCTSFASRLQIVAIEDVPGGDELATPPIS